MVRVTSGQSVVWDGNARIKAMSALSSSALISPNMLCEVPVCNTSSSVTALPSWKYGAVSHVPLNEGVSKFVPRP